MIEKAPCAGRTKLFEPFRLPNESDADRGERLERAQEVCARCPLIAKATCLLAAKNSEHLTRGVWGGKVITELKKKEEKIDIRIR